MSKETPLSFDALTLHLKEAQNARSSLEKDLTGKRQTRHEVEKTFESVNAKLNQTKDIHAKMQETMKIAQHKVVQTQSLSESLGSTNEGKRETLTRCGEQIQSTEEGRESDILQIEDELSMLSQLLREAKNLYNDDMLDQTCEQSITLETELQNKEEDLNGALNEMSRTLQDFFEQEKESDQAEHLDNTEQILSVFDAAQANSQNYLQELNTVIEAS